jgi:hypothetical protein
MPSRGGMLLTLAILSVVVFGPLTGLPAWYMANQDHKEIRSGALADPNGLVGIAKLIAIIGTFCSPLWLIIYFILAEVTIAMLASIVSSF